MHVSWELILLQITVSCVLTDLFSLHPAGAKVSLQYANLLQQNPFSKSLQNSTAVTTYSYSLTEYVKNLPITVLFTIGTNMSPLTAHYNHRPPIHINKVPSETMSRPSQHLALRTYLHVSMYAH